MRTLTALMIGSGIAIGASALLQQSFASAHTQWANGVAVSERIKQLCCGGAEAHLLPPGSVHARADGWHIDGYAKVVPYGVELPSPDGNEWGFWADHQYEGPATLLGGQSAMHCLFLNPRML